MKQAIDSFDHWLIGNEGPAALVIREHLMPVEGHDGVIFPPTFAAGDGFPGGYNIDPPPNRDEPWKFPNVCIIDTVGSQANRIEPIFAEGEYAKLIPQILIKAGDKQINILEVGHRAGDALVRSSELQAQIHSAFIELLKGNNAEPLAKIAPTSLVFGVWDSRDTQGKLPRLISSVIRAFNVEKLTRGAVYIPPVDYAAIEVFSESDKAKAEGNKKNPLAQRGFVHNPASGSHGGVIAKGGIRRNANLSLAALQLLKVGTDKEKTLSLRRYILGLGLVALTANNSSYLRQGCQLVADPEKPTEFVAVYRDGRSEPPDINHSSALKYAKSAAEEFGVGKNQTVAFDMKKAKADVKKKEQ